MSRILVLVRHGQSEWNLLNLFTGWKDPDLTELGVKVATAAGVRLKALGYKYDIAYTSVLTRAQHTLRLILGEVGQPDLKTIRDQALNERDYGELTGLNKDEARKKWGDEQVHIWRRSASVQPPALTKEDPRFPGNQKMYQDLVKSGEMKESELPTTECLVDTAARFKPYFTEVIVPELHKGKRIIIAAHGNSLRALVMELEHLTPEQIISVEIPTGKPLVYELDEKTLKVLNKYYL